MTLAVNQSGTKHHFMLFYLYEPMHATVLVKPWDRGVVPGKVLHSIRPYKGSFYEIYFICIYLL
jgi:hypothetical protein